MSKTAYNWISRMPECEWVSHYFNGLNESISNLKINEQNDIIRRLVSSEDEAYYGAIAEMAYMLLWQHLSWGFDKDPPINKKSPDFRVIFDKISCSSFLCDVTVVRHNHPHEAKVIETTKDFHTPLPLVTSPIEQSQRFLMKIKEKFEKYKEISISCNCPLVIAFFIQDFENAFFLDRFQLRNALFGDETVNFTAGGFYHVPKIIDTDHGEAKVGIFTFDEYKPLAAIIVCEHGFYATSREKLQYPKPHYPQKAKLDFVIFPNPLGEWAYKEKCPFPRGRGCDEGLIDMQVETVFA